MFAIAVYRLHVIMVEPFPSCLIWLIYRSIQLIARLFKCVRGEYTCTHPEDCVPNGDNKTPRPMLPCQSAAGYSQPDMVLNRNSHTNVSVVGTRVKRLVPVINSSRIGSLCVLHNANLRRPQNSPIQLESLLLRVEAAAILLVRLRRLEDRLMNVGIELLSGF